MTTTIMTHYDHLNIDLTAAMGEVARREAMYAKARTRVAKAAALIALFAAQDVSDTIAAELVSISNSQRGISTIHVSAVFREAA